MKSSLLCKEVFTHNKVQHLARCSQAPDDQRKKLAIRVDCSVGPVVQLPAARSKVDAEVPPGTSCRVMYWYSGLYCSYYAFCRPTFFQPVGRIKSVAPLVASLVRHSCIRARVPLPLDVDGNFERVGVLLMFPFRVHAACNCRPELCGAQIQTFDTRLCLCTATQHCSVRAPQRA